jgi:hypothetical protein
MICMTTASLCRDIATSRMHHNETMFCDPCPVVFTAIRTFFEPFAARRSTAGAFIIPPEFTLPAVQPRTNNLAWTMSSPADPIACAMYRSSPSPRSQMRPGATPDAFCNAEARSENQQHFAGRHPLTRARDQGRANATKALGPLVVVPVVSEPPGRTSVPAHAKHWLLTFGASRHASFLSLFVFLFRGQIVERRLILLQFVLIPRYFATEDPTP